MKDAIITVTLLVLALSLTSEAVQVEVSSSLLQDFGIIWSDG